mgnify:CR=1 FL=1
MAEIALTEKTQEERQGRAPGSAQVDHVGQNVPSAH